MRPRRTRASCGARKTRERHPSGQSAETISARRSTVGCGERNRIAGRAVRLARAGTARATRSGYMIGTSWAHLLGQIGKTMTPRGDLNDYYADDLVNAGFFLAAGCGLRRSWFGARSI